MGWHAVKNHSKLKGDQENSHFTELSQDPLRPAFPTQPRIKVYYLYLWKSNQAYYNKWVKIQ